MTPLPSDLAWVLIAGGVFWLLNTLTIEGLRFARWYLVIVKGPEAIAYLKEHGVIPDA